jgi:putative flippase GtrA
VTAPPPVRTVLRPLADPRRLVRYGVAGGCAAATHLGTLTALVELAGERPVVASTVGYVLAVAVSYLLQRAWVFDRRGRHRRLLPRFLAVTGVGLALNTVVLGVGTEVLSLHYVAAQAVALVLIPVSNYLLNSLWTFR